MSVLIIGTIIFFVVHLTPPIKTVREHLVARLGENRYLGLYVASSVVGMMMIIVGKAISEFVHIWTPPAWAGRLSVLIMLPACVLITAMALPTNIKRYTRHPMLWGIALWSAAHCLANGDLASIILFGGFGAYALFSMWSLNQRGAVRSMTIYGPARDVLVIVVGLVGYGALVYLHPYLFGIEAAPELVRTLGVRTG